MLGFKLKKGSALVALTILLVGYQNCSKINVASKDGFEKSSGDQAYLPEGNNPSGENPLEQEEEEGSANTPAVMPGYEQPVVGVTTTTMPGQVSVTSTTVRVPAVGNPPGREVANNNEEESEEEISEESPEYEGNNQFTAIGDNSFLLACGKKIKSITMIGKSAKVVLVNSTLGSITNIQGELMLVNSTSAKPTVGKENVKSVAAVADVAMWEARCKAYEVEEIGSNVDGFAMTALGKNDVDEVPKAAPSYRFTAIEGDVVLENLNTHFFKATSLHNRVSLKIKTDAFRFTGLSNDSVLELY